MSNNSHLNLTALFCIAQHIEPNVVTYTRLAAASPDFYAVFTSDRMWKYLNPYGVESNIFRKFMEVCGQTTVALRLTRMCWERTGTNSMHSIPGDNLYLWLAFALQNSVHALWCIYQQRQARNPSCPLHNPHIRKQLYWCAINPKSPVQLGKDQMDLVVKFIERRDFNDLSMLQGDDKNQLMVILWMCASTHNGRLAKQKLLQHVSSELYRDREFMVAVAKVSPVSLNAVDPELWKDEQFLQSILCIKDPFLHSRIPSWLQTRIQSAPLPREPVPTQSSTGLGEDACTIFQGNQISRAKFIELITKDEDCAKGWTVSLSSDISLVKCMLEANGLTLRYLLPRSLKSNKRLVRIAVQSKGLALQYADPKFFADKDVVTRAVVNDGRALFFASKTLKDDVSVVSAAVSSHPTAILAATKRLQSDPKIIELGFQSGGADFFGMINPNLNARDDEKLVLLAIKWDPAAFLYASRRLASDPEFVLKALETNGAVFLVISTDMQVKEGIKEAIGPVHHFKARQCVASKSSLPTSWVALNPK